MPADHDLATQIRQMVSTAIYAPVPPDADPVALVAQLVGIAQQGRAVIELAAQAAELVATGGTTLALARESADTALDLTAQGQLVRAAGHHLLALVHLLGVPAEERRRAGAWAGR